MRLFDTNQLSVITSYSIHYAKLYESQGATIMIVMAPQAHSEVVLTVDGESAGGSDADELLHVWFLLWPPTARRTYSSLWMSKVCRTSGPAGPSVAPNIIRSLYICP